MSEETYPEGPRRLYESEFPVGLEGRELFSATEGLVEQLDLIGRRILLTAARPDIADKGMTFLLSGDWGVGKSSAMQYLAEFVAERLGPSGRVVFVHYDAQQFESRSAGARATLLFEVVTGLDEHRAELAEAGQPVPYPPAVDFLLGALYGAGTDGFDSGALDPDVAAEAGRLHLQVRLAKALENAARAGLMLEHWLPRYYRLQGSMAPTTVVLIDNLDRCNSPEFVKDVLVTTGYWPRSANHFFVLAADESRVREALAETLIAARAAPDGGLGKYVHVTVRLPDLIPETTPAAAALFTPWLENNDLAEPMRSTLIEHLQPRPGAVGLLGPLLGGCTPRRLKERFNSLVAELSGSTVHTDDVIQHAVLKIRWPKEFVEHIGPAELGDPAQQAWCRHLMDLGRVVLDPYQRTGSGDPASALLDLAKRSGLVLGDCDPLLGLYLASFPARWLEDSRPLLGGPSSRWTPSPGARSSSEDALTMLINRLSTVTEMQNPEMMLEVFEELAPVLDRAGDIPAEHAPALGNAALVFAKLDLDQPALVLHAFAVRADPVHANVNQNYVDFILDNQVRDFYGEAEKTLHRLRSLAGSATNLRPHRTDLLEVRLNIELKRSVDRERYEALMAAALAEGSPWTPGDLFDLLRTTDDLERFDHIRDLGRKLLASEPDDPFEQAQSLRAIADNLSMSSDPADEEFGAELYRFLLRTGLARRFPPRSQAATMTNLAILYLGRGMDDVAGYLLWQGHRLHQDPQKRLRLARCYNTLGDPETARQMLEGRLDIPEQPPAQPPFDHRKLPPSPEAVEYAMPWFDESSYAEPMLPELWGKAGEGR